MKRTTWRTNYRGKLTNMDSKFGLRLGRHREKTTQCRGFALHNPTDFEPDDF